MAECKHDSDLYQSALYLFVNFDPHFLQVCNNMAKDMELRTAFIIERLALAHLAELAADEELAGGTIPKLMPQFAPGMTGTEFYDNWKSNLVRLARADETLAEHMKELQTKYGRPGDFNVGIVELRKREHDAEFAKLPPETQAKIKRADARQQEYIAKRRAERKQDKTN